MLAVISILVEANDREILETEHLYSNNDIFTTSSWGRGGHRQ